MRLKEFIIVLIIFTFLYFGFFALFDIFSLKHDKSKKKKTAKNKINITDYTTFALFYGFQTKLDYDKLLELYMALDIDQVNTINMQELANMYATTTYEIATVTCYFEYLGLLKRRTIILTTNSMVENNMSDQNIISKYFTNLQEKKSFDEIKKIFGESTINDLTRINEVFLFPGVRYFEKVIYYYGGGQNA